MRTRYSGLFVAVLCASLLVDSMSPAYGRGGRGGGGGFSGGARSRGVSRPSRGFSGGGVARPSGGAAIRPAGSLSGASRPSFGSSPSFNRPSAGTARPNLGTGIGGRPAIQPGTRANINAGRGLAGGGRVGSGPSTTPATRPGSGVAAGIGIGAGIANRPSTTLPGLGSGIAGSRLPNQGAGLQERVANRPQTLEDRRSSLNERMTSGRENRQSNRGDMQDDRQEWRDNNREDWQNYGNEHHGDWYNGSWDPGEGWEYMWDHYPVAAALGVTRWGVNRLAYGFGYWGYSNPYATGGSSSSSSYSYSEPLVQYADSGSADGGAVAAPTDPGAAPAEAVSAGPPKPTEAGMAAFEQARESFYAGEYETALTQLDVTLQTMPRDTVVHEFRGLVLFALKKYPDSAAAVYAVLSAGPGWDWTTMSGLYPNAEVYTRQLRELETFMKSNPTSADASFLLGYHYLTMGHQDVAQAYFGKALKQLPGDRLLTQLTGTTALVSQDTKSSPTTSPAPAELTPDQILTVDRMVGTWTASSGEAEFELTLTNDGAFVWSYSRGKRKSSVKGVFTVDQNNLAMEPDAGGTMLAEITNTGPNQFQFKMVGGEPDDKGLMFSRN